MLEIQITHYLHKLCKNKPKKKKYVTGCCAKTPGRVRSLIISITDLPLHNYIHKETTNTLESLPVYIDR